ncbi:MAG: DUF2607 family protein [Oceanospirillaceae bacterium]|nr:DUF2607 family protein [Oceanospirillaceae bacterium]
MPNLKFPAKLINYLIVLLLLLSTQGSIAHNLDFDEAHHAKHHCSLFQNGSDVLPSIAICVAPIFSGVIKFTALPTLLSEQRLITAYARGPPGILFPV